MSEFKYKYKQYLNLNLSNFFFIFRHIRLNSKPSVNCNETKFKDLDIQNNLIYKLIKKPNSVVLIDKDNTITLPYFNYVDNETKMKIKEFQTIVGYENVLLFSNTIGSSDDDNIKNNIYIKTKEEELGLKIFIHNGKKPKISSSILNQFKDKNVLVIGDRLFVDIYMANEYCFSSILVKPINMDKDNFMVKFLRRIENIVLKF